MLTDVSSVSEGATAMAIQSDGKIVVAGVADNSPTIDDFALVRYNSNGSLDTTFGVNGKVTTDFFSHLDEARAMAIQADGKILVAGSVIAPGGREVFALARYTSNGSLDANFGINGKVTTDFFFSTCRINAMILQPNGKILAGGTAEDNRIPGSSTTNFALARYNTDGSLDSTFGVAGKVSTSIFGPSQFSNALALQSDGKIIQAGGASTLTLTGRDFALVRFNSNGSLDTSFGSSGKVTTDFNLGDDAIHGVAIQANGKIVAVGEAVNNFFDVDFGLARYNSDGSPDASFGGAGKVITTFSGAFDLCNAVALQHDGKIVVAGGTSLSFALARYEGDPPLANFDICLQDESNRNLLQINLTTGDYQFTNCFGFTLGGTGILKKKGNITTLEDSRADHKVMAKIDGSKATASIYSYPNGVSYTISDRNITNNTCSCR